MNQKNARSTRPGELFTETNIVLFVSDILHPGDLQTACTFANQGPMPSRTAPVHDRSGVIYSKNIVLHFMSRRGGY